MQQKFLPVLLKPVYKRLQVPTHVAEPTAGPRIPLDFFVFLLKPVYKRLQVPTHIAEPTAGPRIPLDFVLCSVSTLQG
jgi:hypothetical protein